MINPRIFICHSSRDKTFVKKLAYDLINAGIDVWLDELEIKVGRSIIDEINDGIKKCSHMGIVLSPNSMQSEWVKKELNAFLTKVIKKKKVAILPILYKECEIPPLLDDIKKANFIQSYNNGLEELLNVFNIRKFSREKKEINEVHLITDDQYYNILYKVNKKNIDNIREFKDMVIIVPNLFLPVELGTCNPGTIISFDVEEVYGNKISCIILDEENYRYYDTSDIIKKSIFSGVNESKYNSKVKIKRRSKYYFILTSRARLKERKVWYNVELRKN
jgi:hypothetical protein